MADSSSTDRARALGEALRQQTELVEALFDALRAFAVVLDLEGKVVKLNRFAEELTGWSLGEVLGLSWFDTFLPAAVRQEARGMFLRALEVGSPARSAHPILTRAGEEREIEWSWTQLTSEKGAPRGLLAVGLDLTERLGRGRGLREPNAPLEARLDEGATALARDQDRLRRVLDGLFAFVGIYDLEGTLLEANQAPLTAAGLARGEVLGRPFWETYWWSHSPSTQEEVRRALARAAQGERVRYDAEIRIAKDERRIIDVAFGPLRGPDGEIEELIGCAVDVTERRRIEAELRSAERELRVITDSLPLLVAYVDAEQRYRFVNATYEDWYATPRESIQDKRISELLSPETYSKVQPHVLRALAGEEVRYEETAHYPSGKQRHVRVYYLPDVAEGEVLGFFAVILDESERVEREQALEFSQARLRASEERLETLVEERTRELRLAQEELVRRERLATLGQLTATVSHELRNPLAAMRLALFVLGEKLDGDVQTTRPLEQLAQGMQRCEGIVTELLDFARVQDLHLTPTELDPWVADLLAEQARDGVEHVTELGLDGCAPRVDTDRLRRAVINLLENARQSLEACLESTPRIGVRTLRGPRGRLEIQVQDNGPGVPADLVDQIFEPLHSTKSFGVGLGLPTVRQIMRLHGGDVELTQTGGSGACFTLWLPGDAAP